MSGFAEVITAAAEVETLFRAKGWKFCFIGGIAVQRWGSPRFTQDVDLTLLAGFGREAEYVKGVLELFPGRRPDASEFALRNRVILARNTAGTDLDISLGALPFEEHSIARSSPWAVNDRTSLNTCSAEDLIVYKLVAGRDRDWSDVESVLARQHGHLKVKQIYEELTPLLELKEDTDSLDRFERMKTRIDDRIRKARQGPTS